jgi:ornithine carbamoyltransferase
MRQVGELVGSSGARLVVTSDPSEALRGCAAIYGDVWVSMGEEHLTSERIRMLANYKITTTMMRHTGRADTIFLHCLPALHAGSTEFEAKQPGVQDVDEETFESAASRVFDQAENRMHTAKALMVATIG